MPVVKCLNTKCEYHRDEICPVDSTDCRIKMWDEIADCPESILESQPAESQGDGQALHTTAVA